MIHSHKHLAPSQRMLRVGELVRHALAELLMRGEIIDPVIETATITVPEVRMTPDLKLAKAYVIPLGGAHADDVVAALNRHARFVRGEVGHRIDLKYAPEIRFFVDDTFEEADRIENLLRSERVQKDLHPDGDGDEDGEA
jgi:ribosome-binding factor A